MQPITADTRTTVLHIWRPEACDDGRGDSAVRVAPHDGTETYLCESVESALALADQLAEIHVEWKFHVETISAWEEPPQ